MTTMVYSKMSRLILLYLLLLCQDKETLVNGQQAPTRRPQQQSTASGEKIPIKFHEDHRLIQWCVNGVDEPEFKKFPWSEFSPILQRRYYEHYSANVRFKYTIDLHPLKLALTSTNPDFQTNVGSGSNLLQRVHFVLRAQKRKEFRYNVKASYNESIIEGLLVQVNFAPLGVGMPAIAQFVHPKDFNCVDCRKPIGIPIACRRRTYIHTVHPTLLAFHHRMLVPEEEKRRRKKNCIDSKVEEIKQCVLRGILPNPDTLPPASPGLVPVGLGLTPAQPTLYHDWTKTDMVQYIGKPHPYIPATCRTDSDCDHLFKDWFAGMPSDGSQGIGGPNSGCCHHPGSEFCNDHVFPPPTPPQDFTTCPCQTGQTPIAQGSGGGGGGAAPGGAAPGGSGGGAAPGGGGGGAGNGTGNSSLTTPVCDCLALSPFCPQGITKEYQIYSDPRRQSTNWPAWECKPPTVAVCRPPHWAETSNDPWETITAVREDHSQSQPPPPLDGLPLDGSQECCMGQCPPSAPAPSASNAVAKQPTLVCPPNAPVKTVCTRRFHLPYHLAFQAETPAPSTADCDELGNLKHFKQSPEVHGNLVWYSPPCDLSPKDKRVRFQMLIVHSFSKGVYSIVESDDYYDLKTGQSQDLNPSIPSPLFAEFNHFCEKPIQTVGYLYSRVFQRTPFDYSRSYDQCVQQIGDNVNHQICESSTPHFVPFKASTSRRTGKALVTARVPKCDPDQKFSDHLPCEDSCPTLESTTEYVETSTTYHPIKRSVHGAINIITNFCIMPICIFVARFYKETYNLQSFKGQRTWFWMHMIGSGGSTVLMYMGYFTGKMVDLRDPHVLYGNVYIIFLGLSYITSWMRHKNRLISSIMEICHSTGGYGCLILALFCVTNAKYNGVPISDAVKLVVYVAIASLTIFYVGMTVHICSMDRKFGMKPRRWHFPIVESRFDDLPVPGRRVRQFFLFALLFVNLPLTIATLFL